MQWAVESEVAKVCVVAGADDMLRHDPNMLRCVALFFFVCEGRTWVGELTLVLLLNIYKPADPDHLLGRLGGRQRGTSGQV